MLLWNQEVLQVKNEKTFVYVSMKPILEFYFVPSPHHHQKEQCPHEWNSLGETLPNVALISARIWFGCIFPFSLN